MQQSIGNYLYHILVYNVILSEKRSDMFTKFAVFTVDYGKLVVLPDDCCNIAALPLSLSGIIFIVVFPVFIVIVEFVFIFALLFKIVTDIRVTFQDASPYPSSQAHKRFSACRDFSPFCLSLSAQTDV